MRATTRTGDAEAESPPDGGGDGSCISKGFRLEAPPGEARGGPAMESYDTGREGESAMTDQRKPPAEVWLRGNVRPVAALAVVAALVLAGGIAATTLSTAGRPFRPAALAAGAVAAAGIGLLAAAAARPRLLLDRQALVVRLAPGRVETVPLDVAECFFPGSHPLTRGGEQTCEHHAAFRVNTLVLRLAERADDYRRRATFTPWGTWDDSYVVFDGRWCEPLSPELARQLGRRLIDAKREAQREAAVAAADP